MKRMNRTVLAAVAVMAMVGVIAPTAQSAMSG